VSVPVEDELGQVSCGESKRFGGGESFKEGFEMTGEFGLMTVDGIDELLGGFFTLLPEQAAEVICFMGSRSDEVALDVEVADGAGSSAKFTKEPSGFFRLLCVGWKMRQE
jgi:hypothetical protein